MRFMEVGSCLIMLGGWLESLFIYNGSSLGFLYSLYFPLAKSNVISRKFMTYEFASAVIFSPKDLKQLCSSFLVLSVKHADLIFRIATYPPTHTIPQFVCGKLST